MIDLHIHTTNSDGTSSVKEILEKAEELGLTYISITDHESCGGYEELKNMDWEKIYTGTIIPGIELKAMYHGRVIDILGYQIHTDKMKAWLEDFYEGKDHASIQKRYLKKYYETCQKLGIPTIPLEDMVWEPEHDWASPVIYREIKKEEKNRKYLSEEAWNDFDIFKKEYCYNPKSEFYIDKSDDHPTIEQVIGAIHQAGGKAFVAHAYIYKWAEDKKAFIKNLLDNYPFDGVECYYSKFTEDQIQYVLEECKKRGLYCSGGCDYHGKNKPGIELGIGTGNFSIPDKLIQDWISK